MRKKIVELGLFALMIIAITAAGFWLIRTLVVPVVVVHHEPPIVAAVPAPVIQPIVVTAMPSSIAANQVALEAIWTAGGSGYHKVVDTLVDAYAAKMDSHCNVAGFNIGPAVAAYGAFVPHGVEDTFRSMVKKQIAAMACEKMNGPRAVAILQS